MQAAKVLLAATLVSVGFGGITQRAGWTQEVERKVTINLKDVPLRSAVDSLFQGTGLQYSIDPNVPNVPVNLTIRDVGLQPALRILIRQAAVAIPGLTSSREGDIYVVKIRPPVAATQPMPEDAPPEFTEANTEFVWEKIPVQFNNVAVFVLAFGGQLLPTEADVLQQNQNSGLGGGFGGNNSFGGNSGFGNNSGLGGNNSFGGSSGFGNSGFGNSGFGNTGSGSFNFGGNSGYGNSGYGNTSGSGRRF